MHFNHKTKEMVLVTDKKVKALMILNEDKDAWRTYVSKDMLEEAYQICEQYNSKYLRHVAGLYGNKLLSEPHREEDAAKMLFNSNVSFEQVVLNFIKDSK